MKHEIDFSSLPDYVFIRIEGKASVESVKNLLKSLVGSPKWEAGMRMLVDHRKLNFKDLFAEEMQRIVGLVKKYNKKLGNGACAFVMESPLGCSLVRMYEMPGGAGLHAHLSVFYALDEAVKWLKDQK